MKVMHLIGSLRVGGAEKVVCSLIQGLRATDTCSIVMTMAGGPLERELQQLGVETIIRPFSWPTSIQWIRCVSQEIQQRQIDLLHTHLFTTDMLGRIAARRAGVPVITTLHAPSPWKRSRRLKPYVQRWADLISARHACDALVAISPEVRDFQIRYGGMPAGKMHVIGNPVHTEQFSANPLARERIRSHYGIEPAATVLINVASLRPIKGQEYLLHAFAHLAKERDDLKLLLLGDGPCRQALMALSTALGIARQVIFCGVCPDVAGHLSAADIFVMSSLSEGISMAILEAMASARPIVATSVGGNVDLIQNQENGLLVPSRNPEAMAEAIRRLMQTPVEAHNMGARAAQFVREHYDAPRIARAYTELYRAVITSQPSRIHH